MQYKEISLQELDWYAPEMFSILSSNMALIHPEETVSGDDYALWKAYQQEHFSEKTFIVFEDGDTLAGYFQYSLAPRDTSSYSYGMVWTNLITNDANFVTFTKDSQIASHGHCIKD